MWGHFLLDSPDCVTVVVVVVVVVVFVISVRDVDGVYAWFRRRSHLRFRRYDDAIY